jgi:hypothetical protein
MDGLSFLEVVYEKCLVRPHDGWKKRVRPGVMSQHLSTGTVRVNSAISISVGTRAGFFEQIRA